MNVALSSSERAAALYAALDETREVLETVGHLIPGSSLRDLDHIQRALFGLDVAFRALVTMDLIIGEPERPPTKEE